MTIVVALVAASPLATGTPAQASSPTDEEARWGIRLDDGIPFGLDNHCWGSGFVDQEPGEIVVGGAATFCDWPTGAAVTVETKLYIWINNGWSLLGAQAAAGTDRANATVTTPCEPKFYQLRASHTVSVDGQNYSGTSVTTTTWPPVCQGTPPPKPCDRNSGIDLVTMEDVVAIFGPGYDTQAVRDGLPSLNAQMKAKNIDTPARCAAFLATLKNESGLKYNALQPGKSDYRGRGYIQLTSKGNYKAAGDALGHNFVQTPSDATTLAWSAKVAGWYWTVNRPNSNAAADALDMGLISRYVGYAASAGEDYERCHDFKTALIYFTQAQSAPTGVVCTRHK